MSRVGVIDGIRHIGPTSFRLPTGNMGTVPATTVITSPPRDRFSPMTMTFQSPQSLTEMTSQTVVVSDAMTGAQQTFNLPPGVVSPSR
jgi:hypothetical protein